MFGCGGGPRRPHPRAACPTSSPNPIRDRNRALGRVARSHTRACRLRRRSPTQKMSCGGGGRLSLFRRPTPRTPPFRARDVRARAAALECDREAVDLCAQGGGQAQRVETRTKVPTGDFCPSAFRRLALVFRVEGGDGGVVCHGARRRLSLWPISHHLGTHVPERPEPKPHMADRCALSALRGVRRGRGGLCQLSAASPQAEATPRARVQTPQTRAPTRSQTGLSAINNRLPGQERRYN